MLKVARDLEIIRTRTRFRAGEDILNNRYPPPNIIDDRWRYLEASDQGNTSRCATEAMLTAVEAARWEILGKPEQLDAAKAYELALAREFETNPANGTSLFTPIEVAVHDTKLIEPVALTDQRVIMDCATSEALCNQIMRMKHRYNYGMLVGLNITEAFLHAASDGTLPTGVFKSIGPHGMTVCGVRAPAFGNYISLVNSWGTKHAWNGIVRMPWDMFFNQFIYAVGFRLIVKS